ncbi:hypothetical protein PIROE2DRAFT_15714, partial [Piromyces sp. E2]
PYILFLSPQLTCYVQETETSELYTLNGYDINHCSDSYDESFLFAFVLPKNGKYRSISNTIVDLIMEGQIFRNISPESYIYRTYYDESQLNEIYKSSSRFIIGIIFNENLFNYTIKLDKAFLPPNSKDPIPYYKRIENIYKVGRSSFFKQYESLLDPNRSLYEIFFCPIQKAVDEAILKLVLNNKNFEYEINLGQFAEPFHYCDNSAVLNYHIILPSIIGLFLILPKDIVCFIIDEKEVKTKKAFVLSGVNSSLFSISWLIQYSIKFVFAMALITVTVRIINFIINIEPIIYFLVFGMYGLSTIGLAYLYSVTCKKLKYAESIYLYLSIVTMLTSTYILNVDRSWRIILSSVFSPVGIISLIKEISVIVGTTNNMAFKDLFYVDNVNKKLKYTKKNDISILHSVSFGIPLEGIYGIVGKPGSGIKTLMHIMLGNIKPDSGDIIYDGKKLSSDSDKIKKDIGNI